MRCNQICPHRTKSKIMDEISCALCGCLCGSHPDIKDEYIRDHFICFWCQLQEQIWEQEAQGLD